MPMAKVGVVECQDNRVVLTGNSLCVYPDERQPL